MGCLPMQSFQCRLSVEVCIFEFGIISTCSFPHQSHLLIQVWDCCLCLQLRLKTSLIRFFDKLHRACHLSFLFIIWLSFLTVSSESNWRRSHIPKSYAVRNAIITILIFALFISTAFKPVSKFPTVSQLD